MKRLALLVLVLLAGCSNAGRPFLQCTVDDTLSFTADRVTSVYINGSGLEVIREGDLATIRRNMLPGETCERVDAINWELAP